MGKPAVWIATLVSLILTSANGARDVYDICGPNSTITESSVTIQTPNYPLPYPGNQDCSVRIQALSGQQMRIEAVEFLLEGTTTAGCTADWFRLRLNNGTRTETVFTQCDDKISAGDVWTFSSSDIILEFHSDNTVFRKGFSFNIDVVGCSITTLAIPPRAELKSHDNETAEVQCMEGFYFASEAPDQGSYRCEINTWINVGQQSSCIAPVTTVSTTTRTAPSQLSTRFTTAQSTSTDLPTSVTGGFDTDSDKPNMQFTITLAASGGAAIVIILVAVIVATVILKRKKPKLPNDSGTRHMMRAEETQGEAIHGPYDPPPSRPSSVQFSEAPPTVINGVATADDDTGEPAYDTLGAARGATNATQPYTKLQLESVENKPNGEPVYAQVDKESKRKSRAQLRPSVVLHDNPMYSGRQADTTEFIDKFTDRTQKKKTTAPPPPSK